MPIRPEQRHLYPPDWPELARELKAAAGWRCACEGECGRDHGGRCGEVHGQAATWRAQRQLVAGRVPRVVLTVAHLDHRPDNCDPRNLRVLCQDCHLRHDRPEHARRRRETWAERRRARELAERQARPQLELIASPASPPGDVAAAAELERQRAELYRRERLGQVRFAFAWRSP